MIQTDRTTYMNSSHLLPTKEAGVGTSHSNLPDYAVSTGIDVFFLLVYHYLNA